MVVFAVLTLANLALLVMVGRLLLTKRRATRDSVFTWFLWALVLWPAVSLALSFLAASVIDNKVTVGASTFYPFSEVVAGTMTLGGLVRLLFASHQLASVVLAFVAVKAIRVPE